jgi:hypothetical protein
MASGYYNYVFFTSRNAPFQPIPARFDLTQLPGNTVSYFISNQPPAAMMPGDSYVGIVSQIRSAAAVWNGVSSSALRLSYGGISTVGTPQSTPGIDVIFDDDMPAGLLAQTRVTTPADVSFLANGTSSFVPLLRSTVQLRSNLTTPFQQASFSELFYTTLVHEFGHSLGLQHSLVSGAMATSVTRATTKGNPLSADDVAAVSLLYPAGSYAASTGSITGTVTLGASGVNLASVVALSTSGAAVSTLTNPDGTYAISGIPTGQYYVYVHPLPPAQQGEAYPDNVIPPVDLQQNPFPAVTGFVTQFFSSSNASGTRDWTQATQIGVSAGANVANVNFAVQGSAGPAVYNLQTYAYQGAGGQVPVPSPYLVSGSRLYLVFTANGALVNGTTQMIPGLSVSAIGSAARLEPATLAYYQQGFLYQVIDAAQVPGSVPVALAVTTNTDVYVLPAGVTVTPNAAPAVSSVSGSTDAFGNSTVNLLGANLTGQTLVLFDGAAATQVQTNSDGSLTVAAPAATGTYGAFVEAVNGDGQSSAQALGAAQPPVFTYASPANPSIALSTGTLSAGADALIDITGVNTQFVDGQAVLGFGSSDVQVRRIWVVGRGSVMADVSISAQAAPGTVTVSIADGLQLVTLPALLQILPANPQQISLRAPVTNALTGLAGVPSGGSAVIGITGLPQNATAQTLAGWTLTIGGVNVSNFTLPNSNQINATVPSNIPVGPAVVHLLPPTGDTIPTIAMQVDAAPPNLQPDLAQPVGVGDSVSLTVLNLGADPTIPVLASSVIVLVSGVSQTVTGLTPLSAANAYSVQFTLSGNVPTGQNDTVTVGIGTRQSSPISLAVHN